MHAVVEAPGPLCTVQDLGRRAGRRAGLAPGGAMDQRALLWANRLMDNEPTDAALEVTVGGLSLKFATDTTIAITGADCAASLDGQPVGNWRTIGVGSSQTLRFGFSADGVRAYVAFAGGLDAARVFGSSSMVAREGLPGLLGRAIESGEELRWLDSGRRVPLRSLADEQIPPHPTIVDLPLIPAYEWEAFSTEDRDRVIETRWTLDSASDRTACRLAGAALESGPVELDSVPLVDGTVQVTGDGVPLVFMRDRPTIGGYAKLGSVDPLALDLLAQAQPGTEVRFVLGDPKAMRAALAKREAFFGIETVVRSSRP